MLLRVAALANAGVQMIALLALSDDGAPAYHHEIGFRLHAGEFSPILWLPRSSGGICLNGDSRVD
jgi:hypothetical protein